MAWWLLFQPPVSAGGVPFEAGDVFAGVSQGRILHFDRHGNLRAVLETGSGSQQTGMCLDAGGNLYATNFASSSISKFDKEGRLVVARWGGPFSLRPESCLSDGEGNIYTSEVDGENLIRRFDPAGTPLATFKPRTEARGIDWIDLAADQCTMFYTSEGQSIMRFDVCRNRQLDDFATGLERPCFALRIRSNGEVLAACGGHVYRFAPGGKVISRHRVRDNLFGINLDPDGEHLWTGVLGIGGIYKIDIETGAGTEAPFVPIDATLSGGMMGGLAVYGEQTVARIGRRPGPELSGVALEGMDFGRVPSGSQKSDRLDLGPIEVQGTVEVEVSTDLDLRMVQLEIKDGRAWRPVGRRPINVAINPKQRSWQLRLRVGRCPQASSGPHHLVIGARDADGRPTSTRVALDMIVSEEPWLRCWWPVLATILALLVAAFVVYGFISPSRFTARIGVVLSPEEDMDEGFFHPIRGQRGSRSGFYRDARLYLSEDFRLIPRSRGTLARLRADGHHVRILPMPGVALWRLDLEGEWQQLPAEETTARFGTVYRNQLASLFFELRNG